MEKIAIKGFLKMSSSMDSNTFNLTTEGGTYLGDFYVVSTDIFNKLVKNFRSYAFTTGEMVPSDEHIKPQVKLPVTFEITFRER